MKKRSGLWILVGLLAMNGSAEPDRGTEGQTFEWTNRLELSLPQQELLHIYRSLQDDSIAAEKRQKLQADAKQLSNRLEAATIRHALPWELVMKAEKGGHDHL